MTPTKRNSKKAPKKDRQECNTPSSNSSTESQKEEAKKHALKCFKNRIANHHRKFLKTLQVVGRYHCVLYSFMLKDGKHVIERAYDSRREALKAIREMSEYVEYRRHGSGIQSLRSTVKVPSKRDASTDSESAVSESTESTETLTTDSPKSEVSTEPATVDFETHTPSSITDDITFEDLQDEVSFDAFARMLPPPPATAYIEDVDEVVETTPPVQPISPLSALEHLLKELMQEPNEQKEEPVITEEEENQPEGH